ncbi:MAG: helix-turn-helix transcriptional regulator [Moorea sp. SIO4A3]|nr:helix-turn-helix transcriptional regulator [Moorena sp. SIO4A3]
MKVTTKLAQLRANYGNISYEEISESTGIDRQQLRELENGEANAMKLCFRQRRSLLLPSLNSAPSFTVVRTIC